MWWYRGLAGAALVAGLVACTGDEPAGGKSDRVDRQPAEATAEQSATAPAGDNAGQDSALAGEQDAAAAAGGEQAGAPPSGDGVPAPQPAARQPAELDLSLPEELDILDDSPLQSQPGRLPDLFELEPPRRRTSVSGELIIGDSEDERALDMQRIQGGKIDVEVSID